MASPSKLCSACVNALESGLKIIETEGIYKDCTHHTSFADFRDAVARDCFICVKLWDSISDESLADWSKDPVGWTPFRCYLHRRPWAPDWYGDIYWHIRYVEFDAGPAELKYRGNVFCLLPTDGASISI
jgi:hypothetical protein